MKASTSNDPAADNNNTTPTNNDGDNDVVVSAEPHSSNHHHKSTARKHTRASDIGETKSAIGDMSHNAAGTADASNYRNNGFVVRSAVIAGGRGGIIRDTSSSSLRNNTAADNKY